MNKINKIWQKIKQSRLLLMLLGCLAPLLILVIYFYIFRPYQLSFIWLILFICPFLHLFIHKNHHHGDGAPDNNKEDDSLENIYQRKNSQTNVDNGAIKKL